MSEKRGGDINHRLRHTFSGVHVDLRRPAPSHHRNRRMKEVRDALEGAVGMFSIHILMSPCCELQMELAGDSLRFIENLLDVFHLVKGNVSEKAKTDLVEVKFFAP